MTRLFKFKVTILKSGKKYIKSTINIGLLQGFYRFDDSIL